MRVLQINERGAEVGVVKDRLRIVPMIADDIPAMCALEKAAWPPALQASMETMKVRAKLGHTFLGAWLGSELIGAAYFVLTRSDPFVAAAFPRIFSEFSSIERSAPALSGYVYNLCIHPAHRGQSVVRQLIAAGIEILRDEGCLYLVGDGRCPSYSGAAANGFDCAEFDPEFRSVIDNWRATGIKPPDDKIILDPVLRFYKRSLACEFLYLMPHFFPADRASGGHRVIFVKTLR